MLHSLHQLQHGLTASQHQNLLCTHLRHGADGVQHFPAGDALGGKDKGVRGDTFAQQGNTISNGLFRQRDQGHRLAVLIQQHPQHLLGVDISGVCQQIGGPLLPQMALQCVAHAQHPGGAILHLHGDTHAGGVRQAVEKLLLLGKAAQGHPVAIGIVVSHGAAAHQRRRCQTHAAQNGAHGTRRALRKNGQSTAAVAEQLQNVPHHLGQVSILAQQQVIQITEHQSGCQRIVHVFFLLRVARKWVK